MSDFLTEFITNVITKKSLIHYFTHTKDKWKQNILTHANTKTSAHTQNKNNVDKKQKFCSNFCATSSRWLFTFSDMSEGKAEVLVTFVFNRFSFVHRYSTVVTSPLQVVCSRRCVITSSTARTRAISGKRPIVLNFNGHPSLVHKITNQSRDLRTCPLIKKSLFLAIFFSLSFFLSFFLSLSHRIEYSN